MKMNFSLRDALVITCAILLLSGCSQKLQNVQDTFKLALFSPDDVYKSKEEIKALSYASIYAKIEQQARAFLVLGFVSEIKFSHAELVDKYALKWMTANNEMLVTLNGRLIKTVNLKSGDLHNIYSNEIDPLLIGLHKKNTPLTWKRKINHSANNMHSFLLTSLFNLKGIQTIDINGELKEALFVEEAVYVANNKHDHTNRFWIDPQSGKILSSIQKVAPKTPFVEINVLKPFSDGV